VKQKTRYTSSGNFGLDGGEGEGLRKGGKYCEKRKKRRTDIQVGDCAPVGARGGTVEGRSESRDGEVLVHDT